MQSEFDKTLKEQLVGYRADFNPADWQQMEGMLKKDSDKPLLLIALLLLMLGMVGLWVGSGETGNNLVAASSNELVNDVVSDMTKAENKTNSTSSSGKSALLASQKPNEIDASKNESNNFIASKKEENQKGESARSKNGLKSKTAQTNSTKPSKAEEFIYEAAKEEAIYSSLRNVESGSIDVNANQQTLDLSFPENEKSSAKRRKHQQVAKFAMGAGTGAVFSFIDASNLTKPGYSTFIAEELMFIDRIGLEFTQGYRTINYDGGRFPYNYGDDSPVSYSSQVKSFNFGIDIKANLMHKSRWNWYVKAGVQNVIKLSETFEYRYPDVDTIPNPNTTLNPPVQNNFNGVFSPNEDAFYAPNSLSPTSEATDITISGAKRYHPEFHFASGFDISMTPKMKLQFELAHAFTKPTVGAENKRLHNTGLNGSFFYIFGK